MFLKNLKSIGILVTMRCNCDCAHCFYFLNNHAQNSIDPDIVEEALKSIQGRHDVQNVHFAGGEPFYAYDVLLECIERCKKYGIQRFGVSTNGIWATSLDLASQRMAELRKLGVISIGVSADAFHQRTVPFENLLNILRAGNATWYTGELDMSTYASSVYIGYSTYDCPANRRTNEILRDIYSEGYYVMTNATTAHGRSISLIPRELHVNRQLNRKCWGFNFGCLHPDGPASVLIDPTGYVDGCFGVPLGNLYEESLMDMFNRYARNPGPVIGMLHKEGALGLKRLAVERGFKAKEAYYDECHLCHKARNYLREHFSDEFGRYLNPVTCYPPANADTEADSTKCTTGEKGHD
jgi:MoaA/NifB/PqqE/SkfB family radical SAM enzyme